MKPYLDDIFQNAKSGYNHDATVWNNARTCNMVTREQWIASIDPLQNNAWQHLHINEPEIAEIQETKAQSYNFFPLFAAILILSVFVLYIVQL